MSPTAAFQLHGEIESSRPLRAPGGTVSVIGWCFIDGVPNAPAVRLVTDAGLVPLTSRTDRTDVAGTFPRAPAAKHSGFVIQGHLPAGVYMARFEAQLPDGSWQCFRELSLAAERPNFAAVLDSPLSHGILSDRVRVGGWALQPDEPLVELSLRYGHRDLPCKLGRPRDDVPAHFPSVPLADRAGFETEDFLLAGHGRARLRGRLASGRIVLAHTNVTISVDRDENHESELNLAAQRIELSTVKPVRTDQAERTTRPLNILFVLHGSFASNSAHQVAALANELSAAGHSCVVAVPQELATFAHLAAPKFRSVAFTEAEAGVTFPNGHGPDIIHAWTPREHVRHFSEKLRQQSGAKVIVHLEDNERHLLALAVKRPVEELDGLSDDEFDRLVPPDYAHPRQAENFLSAADGVTVIVDRLREFVPAGRPCLTLWPAADARFFHPRPLPEQFRRILDRASGETVIFYHGNVHASNAAEVRELYAAVLQLNRQGESVTLLRAGLDTVDFLGALAADVAPHVLDLGQIRHHHQPPLMALADIFVQPGEPDAFNDYRLPSKLPEFFSIGRPVVLPRTNVGALARHGVDAYVLDRADAAGIAAAVVEIRRDPALAERLSHGAQSFAAENFNWRRSAEALAKFYATLTAS